MKLLKSKNFILLALLIIGRGFSFAQGLEFGVFLGASNYYGDLNGQELLLSETHPSVAVIGRYDLKERWTVKGLVGYGRVSGSDANSGSLTDKQRNLSFYSDIYEASLQMELNLVRNSTGYNGNNKLIPYLFLGLGIFNFNPKADYQGNTYELQPLGTEGQGTTEYNDKEKYTLTEFCIPVGFGFKKRVGKHFSVGIDVGMRYTFTNYLDDIGGNYADNRVVERGNGRIAAALADRSTELDGVPLFKEGDPRSRKWMSLNDIYVLGGISIAYRFTPNTVRCPKF